MLTIWLNHTENMICRRKRTLLYILLVSVGSLCMCVILISRLPQDLQPSTVSVDLNHVSIGREVLSGKRDILNIEQNLPFQTGEQYQTKDNKEQHQGNTSQSTSVDVFQDSKCQGPWPGYPNCAAKMSWMSTNWKIDDCYSKHGVNGTMCSFQHYLSVVEKWCPPIKSSAKKSRETATIQLDVEPLLKKMSGNTKFDWISQRIHSRWQKWVTASQHLEAIRPFNHSQKSLLVHIGALTDKAGFKFAENADHGGPLGELVQWSDLIASLHLLGHKLDFSTETNQLSNFLEISSGIGGCPTSSETRYDAVYIDIVGLKQFKKMVKNRLQHYQCLFRVLDSFGTEPQFNFKEWKPTKREHGRIWGNWQLNPRQFMTMYPHTPDNSFLGFVVGSNLSASSSVPYSKKSTGLVYGKELYMWKDKRHYLDVLSRYLDIHATIGTTKQKKEEYDFSVVPGFVINHGILNSTALEKLLEETKVFIGLGFPYEGPAPLEAIAKGCYFLNPVLNPPLNRDNSNFFKSKPTSRALTSQNPYTGEFIGEPYVYTVNIDNLESVKQVMEDIANKPTPAPYLPYEFTYEGMLERVAIYLENQEFCVPHKWPPMTELIAKISNEGETCKDTCHKQGMVCEPEFFPFLNTFEALESNGFTCSSIVTQHSVHGPSHNQQTNTCSLQQNSLLLSCVGSESGVKRLCPCRVYTKGQVALCESCTR